ncbi:interferon-induced, double-stranded RNA-activated protein kinase, putative [Entamoeba invadens IP1]|uniref:Interferon-induced, double-stranded RNA-activated protein kinase, putative n=1 Tax=Entamoeba invadens IP1 TaxID=370355 RepID=A0A0A1U0E2_ENTIV|nr:interferon-induced, double-stranded RNA-activated protein kinase, putative [Entamoeba invadens IP1]ELP87344.1 interferon-induced, double-stranded RNA-activated protein kinase, putative [Entamoeba invadens IP1]|eukprot:XP_004254115.1 interferon-induced, double-stranded RNA-activated protein kinase, putative [Entamoeba invadens IP1]
MDGEVDHYPDFLNKDFVQITKIDKGAFGKIFVARRKDDSKVYVLKLMFGETDKDVESVCDEIVVLASTNHRNVVRYLDAWIESMCVTEYDKYYKEIDEESEECETPKISEKIKTVPSRKKNPNLKVSDLDYELGNKEDDFSENDFNQDWSVEDTAVPDADDIQWGFDEDLDGSDKVTKQSDLKCDCDFDNEIDECQNKSAQEDTENEEIEYFSEKSGIDDEKLSDKDNSSTSSPDAQPDNVANQPITLSHSRLDTRSEQEKLATVRVVVIQMEYCSGSNLSRIIESGELHVSKKNSTEKVSNYFKQIMKGIEYIHSKNIIHGDLKPANIFREGDVLKIGDFGYASLITTNNKCKFVGTPGYTAPEVETGNYDTKIDIYSAGVILMEMCMSCVTRTEFIGGLELLKKGKVSDSVLNYYPQLSELIPKMTNESPERRPTSEEILGRLFGMEETKRKLEGIAPMLQNHFGVFPTIVSKAEYRNSDECVFREKFLEGVGKIQNLMKKIIKMCGGEVRILYPIVPYKVVENNEVTSPLLINCDKNLLVVLNNFNDITKYVMEQRKWKDERVMGVFVGIYDMSNADVANYSGGLILKSSMNEDLTMDIAEIFGIVIELLTKISNNFKIKITNDFINTVIMRLPKDQQKRLFKEENSLPQMIRALKMMKSGRVLQNPFEESSVENFIQELEMYCDVCDNKVFYSSVLHSQSHDGDLLDIEIQINEQVVGSGGVLKRVGRDANESAVGVLLNQTIIALLEEESITKNLDTPQIGDVFIDIENETLLKMVRLYFERSNLHVIESNLYRESNKKWIRVKMTDHSNIVTFDEIEFGTTQISVNLFLEDQIVGGKGNMNILDAIEYIKEVYKSNWIVGEKVNIPSRLALYNKTPVIPSVSVQEEYIKCLIEKNVRFTLSEIQKDKHFDKTLFQKITSTVVKLNQCFGAVADDITVPSVLIVYSKPDKVYIPLMINPSRLQTDK